MMGIQWIISRVVGWASPFARAVLGAAALALCVIGCGVSPSADIPATATARVLTPTPIPTAEMSPVERIAFVSDRDGNSEIYVMDADGTDVTRLTYNSAQDLSPAWSPDGRRIAFASDRDGDFDIYVMNADGSGAIRLTDNYTREYSPAWSPDGRRIAFNTDRIRERGDIYVMNADGADEIQLVNRGEDHEMEVVEPYGEGDTMIANKKGWNVSPAWSPDGQRIAFESDRDGNLEIYVMNADGSDATRLTDNESEDSEPAWTAFAPTGVATVSRATTYTPSAYSAQLTGRIAFVSDRDGNQEIYAVNADGSEEIQLTNNNQWDDAPHAYPLWGSGSPRYLRGSAGAAR